MSTYPVPNQYTPIFNQSSYKTLSEFSSGNYLRKAGGEIVINTETFKGGIKTDTVQDVAGNSLLTKTGLGDNVVSSSLTSVGTLNALNVSGNVSIDSNTLKVDATNNRVGIVTTNPSYPLHVTGDCSLSSGVYRIGASTVVSSSALGGGITSSSLTSVGALTKLDIGGGSNNVSGSGTLLNVSRASRNTDPTAVLMCPQNTTNGDKSSLCFGVDGGNRNCGILSFTYSGNSSTNNSVFLGFNAGGGITQTYNGDRVGIRKTNPTYTLDVDGTANLTTGNTYKINGTDVLTATTLGSGVVTSSLTSVGTLTALTVTGESKLGGGTSTWVEVNSATDAAYLDFHSKASGGNADYDARIISSGGSASTGQGDMVVTAKTITLPPLNSALNTQGYIIHAGSNTSMKFGYALTQSSGSIASLFGPFTYTSPGWKCSGDDSGIYINFANLVPSGCDNWCGHFTLYLKNTVFRRTGVKMYAINKVSGLSAFQGLNLIHDDLKNNIDSGYTSNAAAGTGDIIYWNINSNDDWYSWRVEGAC